MKNLILIAFMLFITFAQAATLDAVQGKLINDTSIATTDLALEIAYTRGGETKTKIVKFDSAGNFLVGEFKSNLDGHWIKVEAFLLDHRTNTRLDIDTGMDFIYDPEIFVEDGYLGKKQRQLYKDFFTEIHLFDWSNMSLHFTTPDGQTFQEYVNQIFIAKGFPEFVNSDEYKWKLTVDSADYVIIRSNQKRYWSSGMRHYFQSLMSPSVISNHNENAECDEHSYDMCLVTRKHNNSINTISLAMGWDHFNDQKEYGFMATKAYDIVELYKFTLKLNLYVFKIHEPIIVHDFALNEKQGWNVSDPENAELTSNKMSDIFVKDRIVRMLPVEQVRMIK
jgi:hypothetical protein